MPAFLSRVAPVSEEAPESATSVGSLPWQNRAPSSFAELFRRHYTEIKAAREGAAGPGYLVVVIQHEDLFVGHGCVTLGDRDASHVFVVGRHPRTDVRLAADPSVALRHLVVRLTLDAARRPTLRVIDLHTGQGFVVEGAGTCTSAVTDGEMAVRLGTYALLFVPLPRETESWPETPEQAEAIRPRTVVRDLRSEGGAGLTGAGVDEGPSVRIVPGASVLGAAADQPRDGEVVATLAIGGPAGETVYALGASQLERGVLVGRYARCDVDGTVFPHAEAVSRVHLLLLREGDDVIAIDVASTNGILINSMETRSGRLAPRCTIELGAGNVAHWQLTAAWPTRSPPDLHLN